MKSASARIPDATTAFERACRLLIRSIISDLGKGRPVANYHERVDEAIEEAERRDLGYVLEQLRSAKRCISR